MPAPKFDIPTTTFQHTINYEMNDARGERPGARIRQDQNRVMVLAVLDGSEGQAAFAGRVADVIEGKTLTMSISAQFARVVTECFDSFNRRTYQYVYADRMKHNLERVFGFMAFGFLGVGLGSIPMSGENVTELALDGMMGACALGLLAIDVFSATPSLYTRPLQRLMTRRFAAANREVLKQSFLSAWPKDYGHPNADYPFLSLTPLLVAKIMDPNVTLTDTGSAEAMIAEAMRDTIVAGKPWVFNNALQKAFDECPVRHTGEILTGRQRRPLVKFAPV